MPVDVEKIKAELTRLDKVYELHSYPGADHAFQINGSGSYPLEAARDSWKELLAWLHKRLKE